MTAPTLPSAESEPLALVALTRDDRVALGFARAVLRLLGESEDEGTPRRAEYFRRSDQLDAIADRARSSVVRGGQPCDPQGIIGRNDHGRKG